MRKMDSWPRLSDSLLHSPPFSAKQAKMCQHRGSDYYIHVEMGDISQQSSTQESRWTKAKHFSSSQKQTVLCKATIKWLL
jgi:hypothetical protein